MRHVAKPGTTWGSAAVATLVAALATAGCNGGSSPSNSAAPASPPAVTKPVFGTFGVDLTTRKAW